MNSFDIAYKIIGKQYKRYIIAMAVFYCYNTIVSIDVMSQYREKIDRILIFHFMII